MTGAEMAQKPSLRSRAPLAAASSRARKSATLTVQSRGAMAGIMSWTAAAAKRPLPSGARGFNPSASPAPWRQDPR
jgi:hypothetical protein